MNTAKSSDCEVEIFYHIFQRSFYDSNDDQHGDLKGLERKLDYIVELGATCIMLVPLYESSFYHNYFASDFRRIDAKYGSRQDFHSLVKVAHQKGLKIYVDIEMQYLAEDHLWFQDSFQNPESKYSNHIVYNGVGNTEPETIIFDLSELESFDGTVKKVATLNLYHPEIRSYILEEFLFLLDPLGDRSFECGVDGFRIDHMMDDLDEKGKLTSLLDKFWRPLIDKVKSYNPKVKFIGEQADWESYGRPYFVVADVDYMFAFPLKFAIEKWDKGEITKAINDLSYYTPRYKDQIIFLENHDTDRFASTVQSSVGKLRIGAVLNLLLNGTPAIYYGQELGMRGEGGFEASAITDGNDIPRREAFPWFANKEQEGSCNWYKDTGPWWDHRFSRNSDGISVEKQINDPESLLNFYKEIIELRKSSIAFSRGEISFVESGSDQVLVFARIHASEGFLIVLNLSEHQLKLDLQLEGVGQELGKKILSVPRSSSDQKQGSGLIEGFGICIYEL